MKSADGASRSSSIDSATICTPPPIPFETLSDRQQLDDEVASGFLDQIRTTTAVFLSIMLLSVEPGRPAECPCFDLFRSGQVIACTKRRRACVLSRLSHLNRQTGLWRVRMLASGAPCAHQQSMCAAPNAGGIGTMKTSLRRVLVGALFAFVGALLIDGTAHAQAGCTGPDPFAALGGGTCYKGGWFPPGMAIPGGGATSPLPRQRRLRSARRGPVRSARRRTCYKGGWFRRAWRSQAARYDHPVAAPAAPSACTTPDPFAALGGGTC